MIERCSSLRRPIRLSAIALLAAIVLNVPAAFAQTPPGPASNFAVLAGAAVTCTNGTVTGDLGVWPGTAVTQTNCSLTGIVHAADAAAEQAFLGFTAAYNQLRDHPPACRATLTATLNETLLPGVYCVDATAKTGLLMLDARGRSNAAWTFLVAGALTGTSFKVVMLNGGQACNVAWWVRDAATMTDSNVLGTILAGAAITVTRGTLKGNAWAKAAVTLTGPAVSACQINLPDPGPAICVDEDRDRDHHDGDHHHGDHDGHDGDHDGHHGNHDDKHHKDGKDKDRDDDRNDNSGHWDQDKDKGESGGAKNRR